MDLRGTSIGGWAAAFLVLLAAAVCVRLGFWQLDRHAQRQVYNGAVEAALARPPAELDAERTAALAKHPADAEHLRVLVRGDFLEGDVIWRGRSRDGSPGVHLLSPLRVEGSTFVVLVDRGWVPSPDGTRIDPRALSRTPQVELVAIGRAFPTGRVEANPVWAKVDADSLFTVGRLDPVLLGQHVDGPLAGFYLQELSSDGRRDPPIPAASPALGEGPHLGYAVQWFGFATVFVVGLAVMVVRARG